MNIGTPFCLPKSVNRADKIRNWIHLTRDQELFNFIVVRNDEDGFSCDLKNSSAANCTSSRTRSARRFTTSP